MRGSHRTLAQATERLINSIFHSQSRSLARAAFFIHFSRCGNCSKIEFALTEIKKVVSGLCNSYSWPKTQALFCAIVLGFDQIASRAWCNSPLQDAYNTTPITTIFKSHARPYTAASRLLERSSVGGNRRLRHRHCRRRSLHRRHRACRQATASLLPT